MQWNRTRLSHREGLFFHPSRVARVVISLAAVVIAVACTRNAPGSGPEGHTTVQHIMVDGVSRMYRLHLPAHFDSGRPTPLAIVLHGHGESAENFERYTGMSAEADAQRFIVVYPQALGTPSVWHTAVDGSDAHDDVDFVRLLIHHLEHEYAIDRRRVYVAGHSNGGFMAYRLASLLSNEIAAVGVSAGSIGMVGARGDTMHFAAPEHAVSVIHFHSMNDPSVPYTGGHESDGPDNVLGVAQTIRFWTRVDRCQPTPASHTVSSDGNVVVDTYTPCDRGTAVVLYTIVDGAHRWPGDYLPWWTFPGPEIRDVNATDRMWQFFVTHPREQ